MAGTTSPLRLALDIGERMVHEEDWDADLVDALACQFHVDAGAGLTRWRLATGGPDSVRVTVSGCPPLSSAYLDAAREVAPYHPGIRAMIRAGTREPVRLSDVVQLPRFWGTPTFERMHGHVPDARYPVSCLLSASPAEVVFIGLHRTRRDFTDADMSDLTQVQAVLATAFQYSAARNAARSAALERLDGPTSAASPRATARLSPGGHVTTREAQVLDLLVQGWSNTQIGRRLGISERTVRKHLDAVYDKAGARGRAAAAAWWQERRPRHG